MTLRWVPGWNGLTEPEAVSYVAAVEAADGEPLEYGVARAINDFVLGCKNDGIWSAIKASCILAGARTLNGALVPLVGAAPTNYNFVAGDYNRETGLVGDGSTKYLNSNQSNNLGTGSQNSGHLASYATTVTDGPAMGTSTYTVNGWSGLYFDLTSSYFNVGLNRAANSFHSAPGVVLAGFNGVSRSNSSQTTARRNGGNHVKNNSSFSPSNDDIKIFTGVSGYGSSRFAFYSIGEFLDLALLDARVTTLITAIGAAIP